MTTKYASDFPLPGGVDQYFVSLLRLLRHARDAQPSHDALVRWIGDTFGATGASAVASYINSVTRMGLLGSKDHALRPTPDGLELLDLADRAEQEARERVLLIKLRDVLGYDVLIGLLLAAPKTFDEAKTALIRALDADWTSPNQTMFRMNWLRSLGLVERDERLYRLTPAGAAAAQAHGIVAPPAHPAPPRPSRSDRTAPPPTAPGATTPLRARAFEIAQQLAQSATEGGTGSALELAALEAFKFLGFATRHLGGAGNPDLVATAPMGTREYRVLVETKSRSSGVVNQNDVNFQALNGHKAMSDADHTVVLAADFAGGNLETWAHQHGVRLLRVDELRQVLFAHAEAVIPLDALRPLFDGGGPTAENVLTDALAVSETAKVTMSLARSVYDAVQTHQDDEVPLDARSLFYVLGREHAVKAIEAAIALLTSDLLSALGRTEHGGLYTRITPPMLDQKLRQFLALVGAPDPRR